MSKQDFLKRIEKEIFTLSGHNTIEEALNYQAKNCKLVNWFEHFIKKHNNVLQRLDESKRIDFFAKYSFFLGQTCQIAILQSLLISFSKTETKEKHFERLETAQKEYVETGLIWETVSEVLGSDFLDNCNEKQWWGS